MVKSSKLKSIYGKKTVEDQKKIYKEWAATYDADTTGEYGWMGFRPAAEELAKRITDKNAHILDAGCGTGLAGVALSKLGYDNIDGKDLSPEMLEKASRTGVYQILSEVDLTKTLSIANPYDAVFSCGVFGFGPPYAEHLRHLVAATKSDGYVVVTVNGHGWAEKKWSTELPKVITEFDLNLEAQLDIEYLENEGIDGKLLIFKA